MKNIFYPFLTLLLVAFVQVNSANAQQINAKIQEVYGDKTQELVANDPEKLAFLTNLIDNRIKIINMPGNGGGKEVYTNLSTISLLNKYNATMTRDLVFDPNNFNPLKYNFKFSSPKTEVYRVDNTDYLIVINPQTTSK